MLERKGSLQHKLNSNLTFSMRLTKYRVKLTLVLPRWWARRYPFSFLLFNYVYFYSMAPKHNIIILLSHFSFWRNCLASGSFICPQFNFSMTWMILAPSSCKSFFSCPWKEVNRGTVNYTTSRLGISYQISPSLRLCQGSSTSKNLTELRAKQSHFERVSKSLTDLRFTHPKSPFCPCNGNIHSLNIRNKANSPIGRSPDTWENDDVSLLALKGIHGVEIKGHWRKFVLLHNWIKLPSEETKLLPVGSDNPHRNFPTGSKFLSFFLQVLMEGKENKINFTQNLKKSTKNNQNRKGIEVDKWAAETWSEAIVVQRKGKEGNNFYFYCEQCNCHVGFRAILIGLTGADLLFSPTDIKKQVWF